MSQTKWIADPLHSEVNFKVKHLMISTVKGQFKDFSIEAETDDNDFGTLRNLLFTAEVDSINTNNAQRDAHLKSADFFHAEQNPQIKFVGKKYEVNGGEGSVTGDLTIAGTTKEISVNVEYGGIAIDGYGQTKAGFTVTGKINRSDFGITYNSITETGGVLLSDEIKIDADVQLTKQAESVEAVA